MPAREHTGICRHAKQFRSPRLTRLAAEIEAELGGAFAPHGAQLRVVPVRISHLTSVGEGVALELDPEDTAEWNWWGDFESDIEISQRRRFSRTWHERLTEGEVRAWLRAEAKTYLDKLNPPRSDPLQGTFPNAGPGHVPDAGSRPRPIE